MREKRRLRHRAMTIAGSVLLVLIIMMIGIVFFFPENLVRHTLGAQASNKIGREFAIDGPFRIDWDWTTPRVHAEGIRIANTAGSADKNMVSIKSLDFSINIWRLLSGRMVIPELSAVEPRIVLERQDEKNANWEFPAFSKANAAASAALPQTRRDFPILGEMRFSSGELVYRDAVKKLDVSLKLDTATGDQERREFKVSGHGTLQGQNFDLDATGGSLMMLRTDRHPYPLDLTLSMGATKIAVKGSFDDPVQMKGIDATLELSGHNLADLFYLTGIPLPPTPAYKLSGALKKDADTWGFENFKGTVGGSDLSGNLTYETVNDRGMVKANLFSNKMDIDDLGGLIGLSPKAAKAQDGEQQEKAAEQKASPRLLPDVPINLDRLRSADMDVTLKVLQIHAPGWPFQDMDARFLLDNGVLKVDPLKFDMADGSVDGSLKLDGTKDIPDVSSNLDLKKLSLKGFFAGTRFEALSSGHIGGHIELAGRGKTLADVLGVSNGRVVAVMSGGTVSLLLVRAANIDLQKAPPLFVGPDEKTEVRCAIADFKVDNGVLTSQIFNIDTTASNLSGPTAINLRNETIDAKIVSQAKDPSFVAGQIPITITGPLKSPSIGLDPVEAGKRGAVAVALGAVLTPLASIIPFIDMGVGKDSNCGALIAKAKADAGAPVKTN
ncbi:MAG: hypothetical protein JWO78_857 [Micavibrio sp.]|nr:hypothetical protein [Micavibrio sp.]